MLSFRGAKPRGIYVMDVSFEIRKLSENSCCHKYVPFEIRKLSEYVIAMVMKIFDSAKGFYALGNTGNSLPVPEGREDMPNTNNFFQASCACAPRQHVVWATLASTSW